MADSDPWIDQALHSERPAVEQASWIVLVLVAAGILWLSGSFLVYYGVDDLLSELQNYRGDGGIAALQASIEYVVIPLAAITAMWMRLGTDKIRAVRDTWVGPYLPLFMAASIIGLLGYLEWSSNYPQAGYGPDGFAFVRWPGTALAATFAIVWLPLFPRVTALLAGMITGVAIFALFGYLFFESSLSHGIECRIGPFAYSSLAILIGLSLLSDIGWLRLVPIGGALALFAAFFEPTAIEVVFALFLVVSAGLALVSLFKRPMTARPLTCAVVGALLAMGLVVLGGDFGYSCGSPQGS